MSQPSDPEQPSNEGQPLAAPPAWDPPPSAGPPPSTPPSQPPGPGWGPPPGSGGGTPPPGAYPQSAGYPQSGGFPQGGGYATPAGYGTPGMYLHQGSGLMLPEGTELASVGRRIGAYFLAIPLVVVTLVIGYVIWGLIVWGRGQTPALQVLGMRVYRPDDGKVAGWGWMALREIVGQVVEGVVGIITQIVSLVLFLSRSDRRSLHDLIAGTVVLYDPNKVLAT